MIADTRYADRIPLIRNELRKCAHFRATTSYARLGRIVHIPTQGPWRGVLDLVSQGELADGRPDITHLIVNLRTGVSSRIEYHDAHKPTEEQRQRAEQIKNDCWDYYKGRDDVLE